MDQTPAFGELLFRVARRSATRPGHTLVVKLGGSALEDPAVVYGTLRSLATLFHLGVPVVAVHGGGKPIDRALADEGIRTVKVQGRRVTDDATLGVVVRVLYDINRALAATLASEFAVNCLELPGLRSPILEGERLLLPGLDLQPVDLGHVGTVSRVDSGALKQALAARRLPLLPCLAVGPDGGWLNVNADTVAAALAGALAPSEVVFLTDTPGVLERFPDLATRLDRLTRRGCHDLTSSGVIHGGMVPKVEACLAALDAGATRAVILDSRDPEALLRDDLSLGRPGTEITDT